MPIDSGDRDRRKQKCPSCGNPAHPSQSRCSFCGRELPPLPPPMGSLSLDWTREQRTQRDRDGVGEERQASKQEPPALQKCCLCGHTSLFWNASGGNYECLNRDCRAMGKTPDALFCWKSALSKVNEKQEKKRERTVEEQDDKSSGDRGRLAESGHSPLGRAWWVNEYYDAKKRRWRRPARSTRWIVKLCLNLLILVGLGFLVRFGYQLFTEQTEPLKNSIILMLGITAWILIIRLARSIRYRWVSPSFKLTAFSVISVLLILSFAGVEPLATYKDAVIEGLTTATKSIEPIAPPETSPPTISYTEAEAEELIIALVNHERQQFGLCTLSKDPLLTSLAKEHSTSMVENNFFGHERYPGEQSFSYNQPPGTIRGENLSKTPTRRLIPGPYLSLQEVCQWAVSGWMDSPGHRENILEPKFTKTGVGVRFSGGYLYITQMFEGAY